VTPCDVTNHSLDEGDHYETCDPYVTPASASKIWAIFGWSIMASAWRSLSKRVKGDGN
jgi:hypothetical protein